MRNFYFSKIRWKYFFSLLPLLVIQLSFLACGQHYKVSKSISENNTENINAFVDLSHHNENVDLETAKKTGLLGFFHKATQGTSFTDNLLVPRIKQGRSLGLLLGAYHFGTAESVEDQVNHFISTLGKLETERIVPVLDWEPNPVETEGTMSKEQAIQFIQLFYKKTGIYPTVYGGYWMLHQLREEEPKDKAVFEKCPLWQGFYAETFGYLDGIWEDWNFLQYTDGSLGPFPHKMEGIGAVDRTIFNGTQKNVIDFWNTHSLTTNTIVGLVQGDKLTQGNKFATWDFLKPGDVIDVVAPSSPPSDPTSSINRIKAFFKDNELKVNIPEGLIDPTPILNESNTVEKRVDFIIEALLNPNSKAVWVILGGGWGTELLSHLKKRIDEISIPSIIKPVIGYSDATAMHIFFNQYLKFPTIHGIELGANGDIEPAWNQSKIQPVLDVLMGITPKLRYELEVISLGNRNPSSTIETQLIGGNLLLVNAVTGSNDFSLDTKNKTLFIESVALDPGEVSRMLHGFRYGNIIQQSDALFLGNFLVNGGHPNTDLQNKQFEKVIENVANQIDMPVFRSLDFGHGSVNNPLPLNTRATITIDATGKKAILEVSAN